VADLSGSSSNTGTVDSSHLETRAGHNTNNNNNNIVTFLLLATLYVKWALCHHHTARSQLVDGEDGLQI
jgi:hypothetical protein